MSDQGLEIVGVVDMLVALLANGRSDYEAAQELATALDRKLIRLAYKSGHICDGVDLAPIVKFVRDFPSRRTSLENDLTAERLQSGGVGAIRMQFEHVCRLAPPAEIESTNRRYADDDALVREAIEGIKADRWANARQAAIALEPRAKGSSAASTIDRLRTKIRQALD